MLKLTARWREFVRQTLRLCDHESVNSVTEAPLRPNENFELIGGSGDTDQSMFTNIAAAPERRMPFAVASVISIEHRKSLT